MKLLDYNLCDESVWRLTDGKDQRSYLNRQELKSVQRTTRFINMNLVDNDKPTSQPRDRKDWDHAKVAVKDNNSLWY